MHFGTVPFSFPQIRRKKRWPCVIFIIVQTVISTIANFQHPSPSASMGTAATDISQLRKSVSALTQVSILYFFISLKTKVSHPPPWVLLGGGSKQYFMVIGHIYTSNWCICQPWCVGWSIKPCQSGVMLVLSLFSFARWTKVKTNWEHMALPFFFFNQTWPFIFICNHSR